MTLALLKHSITKVVSLLSNINDNGDNDEKKIKKTLVGIFKNMAGNIPGGNFLGGNFPEGRFSSGEVDWWEFSG